MHCATGNQNGFTLLEIMVALTIFAVGLLGVAGLQLQSISYNSGSNTRTVATSIAQGALEEILAQDETAAVFQADNADMVWDLDPASAATTRTVPAGGTYSALWSVIADDPVPRMSRVRVTIAGAGRSVTLTGFKRYVP